VISEQAVSHPYCTHVGYSLNCAEYDDLAAIARGRCMICKEPASPLYIDHDHEVGSWAVRGLVCHGCNQRLRRVDSGERPATAAIAQYLAEAWHLSSPRSSLKKARRRPYAKCAYCGRDVAVKENGELWHHWVRRPGVRRLCAGTRSTPDSPSVVTAEDEQPKPARNCKHRNMRMSKGVCPDCKDWVSPAASRTNGGQ
jgi:Recombination endonuclease VII